VGDREETGKNPENASEAAESRYKLNAEIGQMDFEFPLSKLIGS